jgi:putative transcriptional regulator
MPTSRTAAELEDLSETPMTRDELKSARRAPRAKIIRRALGLTQEEFAQTYRIPLDTLRGWEQGVDEPDAPARALLEVIAREPEVAAKALEGRDAA